MAEFEATGRLASWDRTTPDLRDWSDEEVIDGLAQLGIKTDRESFAAEALAWAERLGALGVEERMDYAIEPGRAEILPAGLACLGLALGHLGVETARASGRGLRYGLLRTD